MSVNEEYFMPHSRYVDDDGILITTLSGAVTLNELIGLQNELKSYAHNDEIYELVIHHDDINMIQDSNDSISSADNVKRALNGIRKAALAFVSDKDYVFGLCRQLQMRVENEFIQMCVFRTEETAHKWLYEMKSLNRAYAAEI